MKRLSSRDFFNKKSASAQKRKPVGAVSPKTSDHETVSSKEDIKRELMGQLRWQLCQTQLSQESPRNRESPKPRESPKKRDSSTKKDLPSDDSDNDIFKDRSSETTKSEDRRNKSSAAVDRVKKKLKIDATPSKE